MNKIEFFKKNGFVCIENVFPKKKCKEIANKIEKNKTKLKNYKVYTGWEVLYNPFLISKDLLKFINNKKIINFVEKFLPKNEVLILNMQLATNSFKNRNPKNKKNTHFVHSDFVHPFKGTTNVPEITVMIALDAFKIKNGATSYYKRTHLFGKKPPRNKRMNQVGIKPTTIELKPGSIVFAYGSSWHCVGENITGERRWGIQQRYHPWYYKPMFNYEELKKNKIFKEIKSNKSLLKLFGFDSIVPKPNEKRIYTLTKPYL